MLEVHILQTDDTSYSHRNTTTLSVTNTVQPAYLHRCHSDKLYAIIWSMLINRNMQMSKLIGLSCNNSQQRCIKIDKTVRHAY